MSSISHEDLLEHLVRTNNELVRMRKAFDDHVENEMDQYTMLESIVRDHTVSMVEQSAIIRSSTFWAKIIVALFGFIITGLGMVYVNDHGLLERAISSINSKLEPGDLPVSRAKHESALKRIEKLESLHTR